MLFRTNLRVDLHKICPDNILSNSQICQRIKNRRILLHQFQSYVRFCVHTGLLKVSHSYRLKKYHLTLYNATMHWISIRQQGRRDQLQHSCKVSSARIREQFSADDLRSDASARGKEIATLVSSY